MPHISLLLVPREEKLILKKVVLMYTTQVSMANQKNRGEPGGGGVSPPSWGAVTAWPGPSTATPWPGQSSGPQAVTGILAFVSQFGTGSVSDPDPHSECGLKRAIMKREKNAANRQLIRHKKYRNQRNRYKNVYFDLFSLKFNIIFRL
jgi:hypothetical protein